jgi:3',5'-cyclic AMP phosphodiesterase CpdA
MVQIIHISDLHLFVPRTASGHLQRLISHIPIPRLRQLCGFAFPYAQDALPKAVKDAAAAIPSVLAVTGDTAAWPYDSRRSIDQVYYRYLQDLARGLAASSLSLVTLGNHEWTPDNRTEFRGTGFDHQYEVFNNPRVKFFRFGGVTVLFFIIDTTTAIWPAQGTVQQPTIDFLRDQFTAGRNDRLRVGGGRIQLSSREYAEAVKIVLLHHHTLPNTAYAANLSPLMYSTLKLTNKDDLLHTCRDDIDVFMFGHTHEPRQKEEYGTVMIDAGSATASDPAVPPTNAQFQLVKIENRDSIKVIPHLWKTQLDDFEPQTEAEFYRIAGRWKQR